MLLGEISFVSWDICYQELQVVETGLAELSDLLGTGLCWALFDPILGSFPRSSLPFPDL